MSRDTDLLESLRHLVPRAHDVANLQPRCDLYIYATCPVRGRMVVVIGPHAGIADLLDTFAELKVSTARDRLDVVAFIAQRRGVHGKCNRGRIIYREMELCCRRVSSPAIRQFEVEFAIGHALLLIV